jgi:hypothetical protein
VAFKTYQWLLKPTSGFLNLPVAFKTYQWLLKPTSGF